jgi:addiction module HigA family antidote
LSALMPAEEFLKPLGMSNNRLATEIGVPAQRIGEIVAGKRAITADTDRRLCRFLGLPDGRWSRLQVDDTELTKAVLAKTLATIMPWKQAGEETAGTHGSRAVPATWRRDGKRFGSKTRCDNSLCRLMPAPSRALLKDPRGCFRLRDRMERTDRSRSISQAGHRGSADWSG